MRAGADLCGVDVLTDKAMPGDVRDRLGRATRIQIVRDRVEPHLDRHPLAADQVSLAGFLPADRHTKLAEDFLLAVADACLGSVEAARHGGGGVEQKFALFGENQSPRVAVKQRGVQAFFQRPDLARDR